MEAKSYTHPALCPWRPPAGSRSAPPSNPDHDQRSSPHGLGLACDCAGRSRDGGCKSGQPALIPIDEVSRPLLPRERGVNTW